MYIGLHVRKPVFRGSQTTKAQTSLHVYQMIKFLTAGKFQKQLPQEENRKSQNVIQ